MCFSEFSFATQSNSGDLSDRKRKLASWVVAVANTLCYSVVLCTKSARFWSGYPFSEKEKNNREQGSKARRKRGSDVDGVHCMHLFYLLFYSCFCT